MAGRALVTPHRPAKDGPPLPPELYSEPVEEILIVGEMLHDVRTMDELLRSLPFDREHYRANLRIVAGAATRTRQRCERLLGEFAEPENKIDHPAEPENKIDESVSRGAAAAPVASGSEGESASSPSANGHAKKAKRSTAVPVEGGIKAAVLGALRIGGPMTSTELAESIRTKSGVTPGAVYDCLAKLRTSKEVITERSGAGMVNRIAS
jgi:hypothetical protein